ncbi:SRPBCC family protein [Hyphomicrobium sp. CS1GBMeth3]|uniref:SRPBCC family protein n=1 Tax=Hyphomicrobium sp. CS1GBMeth3 TaxID=1892845 RepID=UPI000931A364|nr:SRPBCC family protein [Hyphomicrobium sp. CS1GBMeth3]
MSDRAIIRSVTHATFKIERTYEAPRAKVFHAFADPIIKRRWFAEGEGWDIETYELDFRIGGTESSSFRFKGGDLIRYDAVFYDIVPDERIIASYAMMIGDTRISASLATTELRSNGKGTKLLFTEQGAYLDGHDAVSEREEGTRQLYEALARELGEK